MLALDVDQDGVHTRSADLTGTVFDGHDHPPVATGDVAALVRRIRTAVRISLRVGTDRHGALRAVALSVANAVDPSTGEILALPNTPFPEGLLSPAQILADLITVPLLVDNDINCAALAEHRSGAAADTQDFAYLFVGAGLGLGLYVDDRLVRGAHGLAGEIGYLAIATGPAEYSTLVTALASQGFGRAGTSAIDVEAIRLALAAAEVTDPGPASAVRQLGAVIGQVIVATCAVVDPELVLLGGPLGATPHCWPRPGAPSPTCPRRRSASSSAPWARRRHCRGPCTLRWTRPTRSSSPHGPERQEPARCLPVPGGPTAGRRSAATPAPPTGEHPRGNRVQDCTASSALTSVSGSVGSPGTSKPCARAYGASPKMQPCPASRYPERRPACPGGTPAPAAPPAPAKCRGRAECRG